MLGNPNKDQPMDELIDYPPTYTAPMPPRIPDHTEQFQASAEMLDGWHNSEDPADLSGPLKLPADGGSGFNDKCKNPIA
jgi:hypothetical protein